MPAWGKDRPPLPGGELVLLEKNAARAVRRAMLLMLAVPVAISWALGFGAGVAVGWWVL